MTDTVLAPEVNDLLLQARGLALVRNLLAQRGASQGELDAHTHELDRVRRRLIDVLSTGG